jgi:hypothetical protein
MFIFERSPLGALVALTVAATFVLLERLLSLDLQP